MIDVPIFDQYDIESFSLVISFPMLIKLCLLLDAILNEMISRKKVSFWWNGILNIEVDYCLG